MIAKKFLIIGDPINHSLSPKIHNYWFRQNNIDANYDKQLTQDKDLIEIIKKIRNNELKGINITVPHKQKIIPLLINFQIYQIKLNQLIQFIKTI